MAPIFENSYCDRCLAVEAWGYPLKQVTVEKREFKSVGSGYPEFDFISFIGEIHGLKSPLKFDAQLNRICPGCSIIFGSRYDIFGTHIFVFIAGMYIPIDLVSQTIVNDIMHDLVCHIRSHHRIVDYIYSRINDILYMLPCRTELNHADVHMCGGDPYVMKQCIAHKSVTALGPRQNDHHFPDAIFK